MRQFYLINTDGQKYNLINDMTRAFLWQPSGLGFQYDKEYMESDGFFFEMNSAVSQTAKTGVLVFFKDPYTQYKAFMDYISSSEGLRLAYSPKGNTWYYVDIDIEYVEKSEIEENGTLQCSISMLPKTPMYLPYELNIDLSGDLGSSIKQYGGLSYAYKYDYTYSNTAVAGEIEFEIPAQMDSGLEITIYGAISSPVMEFYVNGDKYGEIDLSSISVLAGDYVKYSSIPTSAGIYQSVSGVVDDITEQIGLNADYPSFFLLPPNQTIKAVLQADVLTGTSASIKVYEYFMSV